MKRNVAGQIGFFDRIAPRCKWHYNIDENVTTQTQGTLYCGKCNHFLGFTGMYSWRLTPEQAEDEAKEVWCANIGHKGYCPECYSYCGGTGVVNLGINNYWEHNRAGINNMPFSDEDLAALDKAAAERTPIEIVAKKKTKQGTFKFSLEIASFRGKDYEGRAVDYSYYEKLWEDESLLVHVDISGYDRYKNPAGHGRGAKLKDLVNEGARKFAAREFNVVMQGEKKRSDT